MRRPRRHFGTALALLLALAAPFRSNGQNPADPAPPDLHGLTLEQLMQVKVEGAALHPQTLQDAPASVTVITAEDIRKYGYRTLGEALAAVRGFYVDNNRSYETVGVRGFNLPGDYSTHILFMVNGHNMSDNVSDYMPYFGNDFPIDMNLIKQIEIIRGPSSALYGSNAMFATVNIVTKSPGDTVLPTLTADTGSFGEKKGQVMENVAVGGAKILFSGSVFNNTGESPLYFPAYDTPQTDSQTNYGKAINMDGESGYHLFSSVVWRDWTITAAFSGHNQIQPISWGPTIFNDRGTEFRQHRDFVEAMYVRQIAGGTLRWRTYYDATGYKGRADYALGGGTVEENHTKLLGNWVGSQLTYRLRTYPFGDVTLGAEGSFDIRNLQEDYDVSPAPATYLHTSNPDRTLALFAQDEKKLSERWRLDLGIRFDKSQYRPDSVSPRAALLYQRSDWTYKFLYGRSFRNPSAFQLFYGLPFATAANPGARPESADTVEIDVERKLGKRMNLQVSLYGYQLHDFLVELTLPDGLKQYQNVGNIHAMGVELELNGHPLSWLEMTASYAVQRTHDYDRASVLENSPEYLAKLRFSVPLGRKFDLSSGTQYVSRVQTLSDQWITGYTLADFTLTSKHLLPNLDMRLGLRNAFNRGYSDPVALIPTVQLMPQPGRSFFVEWIAHPAR